MTNEDTAAGSATDETAAPTVVELQAEVERLRGEVDRFRDDMLRATDTKEAPWFVANSNDKKRLRLNLITHLLGQIPYKEIKRPKVRLPKRKVTEDKPSSRKHMRFIKEIY